MQLNKIPNNRLQLENAAKKRAISESQHFFSHTIFVCLNCELKKMNKIRILQINLSFPVCITNSTIDGCALCCVS